MPETTEQRRNQFWQSLEGGAGKRCLKCELSLKPRTFLMLSETDRLPTEPVPLYIAQ